MNVRIASTAKHVSNEPRIVSSNPVPAMASRSVSDRLPETSLGGVDLLALGISLGPRLLVEVVEAVDHEAKPPLAVRLVEGTRKSSCSGPGSIRCSKRFRSPPSAEAHSA